MLKVGRSPAQFHLKPLALEVAVEPVEHRLEPRHAVKRRPCTRELVRLSREAEQLDLLAHQPKQREEVLTLFDVAAEVLLGVENEDGCLHLLRIRRGRLLEIRIDVFPKRAAELALEDPEEV